MTTMDMTTSIGMPINMTITKTMNTTMTIRKSLKGLGFDV